MNFEDSNNMVFIPSCPGHLARMSRSASAVPATFSTALTAAQQTYKPLCHSPAYSTPFTASTSIGGTPYWGPISLLDSICTAL